MPDLRTVNLPSLHYVVIYVCLTGRRVPNRQKESARPGADAAWTAETSRREFEKVDERPVQEVNCSPLAP